MTLVTVLEADWSRTYGIDDIEQFLLDPPEPPPAPRRPEVPYIGPERPGDAFTATVDAGELLVASGWTLHHADRNGDRHYTRPGKELRDGSSATVYTDGHCCVWTDATTLEPRRWYDAFGLYAALHHGDDYGLAAAELGRQGYGTRHVELTFIRPQVEHQAEEPQPACGLDLRWVNRIPEEPTPEPPVLIDGFMRRGEMLVIGAPRAIGKSWLAMNIATRLAEGEGMLFDHLPVRRKARVLLCQGELDQWGSEQRWKMLTGLMGPLPEVAETFDRNVRVRTTKKRTTQTIDGVTMTDEYVDAELFPGLEAAIVEHGIDVVILDPWATYFAGNESSNDETEAALDKLRGLTLRHGVSWVIFHHIGKSTEYREPEDAWRGASRLADWASTRMTIMPHYSERQRTDKGLSRRDARTFVDVYMLRRSDPTDDFSMHRGDDGWWRKWAPDAAEELLDAHGAEGQNGRPPARSLRELVNALAGAGGELSSVTDVSDVLGIGRNAARALVDHAVSVGLVALLPGPRTSKRVVMTDLGKDKADRFVSPSALDLSRAEPRGNPSRAETPETPVQLENPWSEQESSRAETSAARNPARLDISPGQSFTSTRPKPPYYVGERGPEGPPPDEPSTESMRLTVDEVFASLDPDMQELL